MGAFEKYNVVRASAMFRLGIEIQAPPPTFPASSVDYITSPLLYTKIPLFPGANRNGIV